MIVKIKSEIEAPVHHNDVENIDMNISLHGASSRDNDENRSNFDTMSRNTNKQISKSTIMHPSLFKRYWFLLPRNWGCGTFTIWLMLSVVCYIFLAVGYYISHQNNDQVYLIAELETFTPLGRNCLVKNVEYRTNTAMSSYKSESGSNVYTCQETWRYEFIVLKNETKKQNKLEVNYTTTVDTSKNTFEPYNGFYNVYSAIETNQACNYQPCTRCFNLEGKFASNSRSYTTDGDTFVVDCWQSPSKDIIDISIKIQDPFWECSEKITNIPQDEEVEMNGFETQQEQEETCYLLRDPRKIINDYYKTQKRFLLIGWILFVPVTSMFSVYACAKTLYKC